MNYFRVTIAALLLTFVACSKKEESQERVSTNPSVAQPLPTTAPEAKPVEPADDDDSGLVVPDELEEKANEAITVKNLESQLDDLEKEIGKSK